MKIYICKSRNIFTKHICTQNWTTHFKRERFFSHNYFHAWHSINRSLSQWWEIDIILEVGAHNIKGHRCESYMIRGGYRRAGKDIICFVLVSHLNIDWIVDGELNFPHFRPRNSMDLNAEDCDLGYPPQRFYFEGAHKAGIYKTCYITFTD